MKPIVLVAAALFALAPCAEAQSGSAPRIEIEHAWARASVGTTGGIFLTIVNKGSAGDHLLAAATPAAARAELHRTLDANGISKMRPVAAVAVAAGATAELKPGGLHIMLLGLKRALKTGQTFPLTLTFERAGTIETTVTVETAGARSGPGMSGMRM